MNIKKYVETNLKFDHDYGINRDCVVVRGYIRVPFFIKDYKLELDHEMIKREKLEVYREDSEDYHYQSISIDGEKYIKKTTKQFEFSTFSYSSIIENEQSRINIINEIKEQMKQDFIEQIEEIIEIGEINYPVIGYCNKKHCSGHVCGTETYYVEYCDISLYTIQSKDFDIYQFHYQESVK